MSNSQPATSEYVTQIPRFEMEIDTFLKSASERLIPRQTQFKSSRVYKESGDGKVHLIENSRIPGSISADLSGIGRESEALSIVEDQLVTMIARTKETSATLEGDAKREKTLVRDTLLIDPMIGRVRRKSEKTVTDSLKVLDKEHKPSMYRQENSYILGADGNALIVLGKQDVTINGEKIDIEVKQNEGGFYTVEMPEGSNYHAKIRKPKWMTPEDGAKDKVTRVIEICHKSDDEFKHPAIKIPTKLNVGSVVQTAKNDINAAIAASQRPR